MLQHFDPAAVPREYGGSGDFRALGAGPAPWEQPGAPRQRRY
jgi:hypothetical protein